MCAKAKYYLSEDQVKVIKLIVVSFGCMISVFDVVDVHLK